MTDDILIHVLNKRVALYQAPRGFRTAMDSVMLAAACPAKKGQSILDLGCGVGSAGLCVLERVENTTLCGIDVQSDHIELAKKNAQTNGFEERTSFLCADVRDDLPIKSFDHVICNPPYKENGKHIASPSSAKATAMGHTDEDMVLQKWTTCAWHHIKGRGSLSIVHEAGRTDAIIRALYSEKKGLRRFGNIDIIPLYPKSGRAAKRVIIRAWKHRQADTTLHPGIVMHKDDDTHTKEADDILRHAAPL